MDRQDVDVPASLFPTRRRQGWREQIGNLMPHARKPRHRHPQAVPLEDHGLRPAEDVNQLMAEEECVRQDGPLVVPRNDDDRNARLRQLQQRLCRRQDGPLRRLGPVEQVSRVDDQVHAELAGPRQHAPEAVDEIIPPRPPPGPRPLRQVRPNVGVGGVQDAKVRDHG